MGSLRLTMAFGRVLGWWCLVAQLALCVVLFGADGLDDTLTEVQELRESQTLQRVSSDQAFKSLSQALGPINKYTHVNGVTAGDSGTGEDKAATSDNKDAVKAPEEKPKSAKEEKRDKVAESAAPALALESLEQ